MPSAVGRPTGARCRFSICGAVSGKGSPVIRLYMDFQNQAEHSPTSLNMPKTNFQVKPNAGNG